VDALIALFAMNAPLTVPDTLTLKIAALEVDFEPEEAVDQVSERRVV